MRRLIGFAHHSPTNPYATFVDEQSERMVELVITNAARAVEKARGEKFQQRCVESDFIGALIDKLQDAGF
jgi:hypothetical protein